MPSFCIQDLDISRVTPELLFCRSCAFSTFLEEKKFARSAFTNNLHPPLNIRHGKHMAGRVGESTDSKGLWGTA